MRVPVHLKVVISTTLFVALSCASGAGGDGGGTDSAMPPADDTAEGDSSADASSGGFDVTRTLLVDDPRLNPWDFSAHRVDGRPALLWLISDYANEEYRLQLLVSDDVDGTAWPEQTASVELDTGGVRVYSPKLLTLEDGLPAVLLSIDGRFGFIRADDPAGSSWQSAVVVNDQVSVGELDATLHEGVPIAACTAKDLVFMRALDATGDAWADPVTIVPEMEQWGGFTAMALAIVDGRPAVAFEYYSYNNDDSLGIYYVRAADAMGETWLEPILVDGKTDLSDGLDLATIDGVATLVYQSESSQVFLSRSEDAAGDSWTAPAPFLNFEGWDWLLGQAPTSGAGTRPVFTFFSHLTWGESETLAVGRISAIAAEVSDGSTWMCGTDFSNNHVNCGELADGVDVSAKVAAVADIDETFVGLVELIVE